MAIQEKLAVAEEEELDVVRYPEGLVLPDKEIGVEMLVLKARTTEAAVGRGSAGVG